MEIDKKEINELYTAARDLFKEYHSALRQAKDDEQFLVNALRCEICSNTISLCIELFYEFTDSPAVETSCRSIIEAVTLLRMVEKSELDKEQIANFRHQSALLFYGNIFDIAEEEKDRFFTDDEDAAMRKKIAWIVDDWKGAMDSYQRKYGSKMDSRVSRAAIREGLFFANKNPKKRKKFTNFVEAYLKDFDDGSGTIYQRISFFAHPWFVDNRHDFELINAYRQIDIELCFRRAQEIFEEKLKSVPEDPDAIENDVSATGDYALRSQLIESVCSSFCIAAPTGQGESLTYEMLCYAFLRDILAEMNVLLGLGYPEIALSKFQAVCEFLSMNALIKESGDAMAAAFDYSTRIQLHNLGCGTPFFTYLSNKETPILREAYDRAPYNSSLPFEDYCQSIGKKGEKSSLAFTDVFLSHSPTCFIGLTRLGIDALFPNNPGGKNYYSLAYLFSIDVHHATGFCYTEPPDCWSYLSHLSLKTTYMFLWEVVKTTGLSSEDRVRSYGVLAKLIKAEADELKIFASKYPEEHV